MQKIPYMLVIGDREAEGGTVSVRYRRDGDLGAQALETFFTALKAEISARRR
jgi:threonyl-tRNA synthetase